MKTFQCLLTLAGVQEDTCALANTQKSLQRVQVTVPPRKGQNSLAKALTGQWPSIEGATPAVDTMVSLCQMWPQLKNVQKYWAQGFGNIRQFLSS